MDCGAISKRVFLCALLSITFLAHAAPTQVTVFNQQDVDRLLQIGNAIQSLKEDVTISLKSLPSHQVERIQSYAFLEVSLEAVQERLNSVLILVGTANVMETWNDQARILNGMYGELLPKTKIYLNAKRTAIINIASGHSADNMYVAYSNRAAGILGDRALPLIDEMYQRIARLRK
jgi:hypothetical protein